MSVPLAGICRRMLLALDLSRRGRGGELLLEA